MSTSIEYDHALLSLYIVYVSKIDLAFVFFAGGLFINYACKDKTSTIMEVPM